MYWVGMVFLDGRSDATVVVCIASSILFSSLQFNTLMVEVIFMRNCMTSSSLLHIVARHSSHNESIDGFEGYRGKSSKVVKNLFVIRLVFSLNGRWT